MVRDYEVLYILDPALSEDETTEQIEKFSQFVTGQGGTVDKAERWERRKLAYEIKGRREGNYILMLCKAGPELPIELDRVFKLSDQVLRGMITRVDEA